MTDSQRPVGVFDSGVGGLTVFRAIRRRLPAEDLLYLGDNARVPYGSKSRETIVRYTEECAGKLVERGVKCLVVACNTVSAVALPALQRRFPGIPVLGVVEPGALAACRASASGRIAVIATRSTVNGGAYVAAIHRHRPDAQVVSAPCPLFVPLAEEGWFDGPEVEGIAARYLAPLFTADPAPDCLVLGCTHYPLLSDVIRRVIGPGPAMVDSAETTAEALVNMLRERGLGNALKHDGDNQFLTTDDAACFAQIGARFLGTDVCRDNVSHISL